MNIAVGLSDLLHISPLIALFLASLIPITVKVLNGNVEQNSYATLWQGMGGLLSAAMLFLTLFVVLSDFPGATAFNGAIIMDGKTMCIGFLALIIGAASLLLMHDNPSTSGEQFSELVFLTLNSVLGMLILIAANDLVVLFIGLEVMSLSLYLMIAMSHEQRYSKEAALKYFILGSLASALLLFGISFLFGTVGTTSLPAIVEQAGNLVHSNQLFTFGIAMAMLGFCFKVSIVPFHAWTPDVYQGAPTPHTALMSTAVKAVSFVAFLRLIETDVLAWSQNLLDVMQWLAVTTMIVGNVAAIVQNNMKRMLAYSSVAHSGYLLAGLIATGVNDPKLVVEGTYDPRIFGASCVMFYLVGYSVMTFGAFALVSILEKNESSSIQVDDLAGYGRKHPALAFCLTVCLLSLAGIPPTVGFFGKFYIFTSAMAEGLIWLALWGVINSVISVYYYLRPIVAMYMKEGGQDLQDHHLGSRMAVVTCAFLILVLGVFSGPLFEVIERAITVEQITAQD
ncbi:MAG: NADH-quinone oxidoreductase subunit N [Bdellovibrio sp.]|nr:MAG: NADH-quinone oxidoreductase subunit N [Bdellovibrio sp.]